MIWSKKTVNVTFHRQLSVGDSFRSTFTIQNSTIQKLEIHSNMIVAIETDFTIKDTSITNITRDSSSHAKVFVAESGSLAIFENVYFEDVSPEIIATTDSTLRLYDTYIKNVASDGHVIEGYNSHNIIIDNLTTYNCETTKYISIIEFRKSTVETIKNSLFEETQLSVFVFRNTNVSSFANNTINGINRGISVLSNSNMVISNSIFQNLVQNIKEEQLYQENIIHGGSAIGNFNPY